MPQGTSASNSPAQPMASRCHGSPCATPAVHLRHSSARYTCCQSTQMHGRCPRAHAAAAAATATACAAAVLGCIGSWCCCCMCHSVLVCVGGACDAKVDEGGIALSIQQHIAYNGHRGPGGEGTRRQQSNRRRGLQLQPSKGARKFPKVVQCVPVNDIKVYLHAHESLSQRNPSTSCATNAGFQPSPGLMSQCTT